MGGRLDRFLDAVPFDRIADEIGILSKTDTGMARDILDTYANESRVSLALITDHLKVGQELLEVGAGLCFTSLFLKSEGYSITALEPAMGGYSLFEKLKNIILEHHSELKLKVITQPAQQLDSAQHGHFDLVFSNNVIEHIPDWPAAMTAMVEVLSAQGRMIHACPNYSVPYEPHYGIPVFRHFPSLSRRLFLSPECNVEIWNSLNFITCNELKKYCNVHDLTFCFKKELLYNSLKRMNTDPLFRQRHQGLIAGMAAFVMRSGLGKLVRHIPPAMATPMIVEIEKRKGAP